MRKWRLLLETLLSLLSSIIRHSDCYSACHSVSSVTTHCASDESERRRMSKVQPKMQPQSEKKIRLPLSRFDSLDSIDTQTEERTERGSTVLAK